MKLPATTAIACAVVIFATAAATAWAGGRGGHGGSHSSASHASHHHHSHTHVFVGSSFFYGPAFYPAPYYYPVPVYAAPQEPPPVYIEQGQDPATMAWYYCQSAHAYYPYVTECPEGWQQVVPDYDPQSAG